MGLLEFLYAAAQKLAEVLLSFTILDPLYLIMLFAIFVVVVLRIFYLLKMAVLAATVGALFPIFLDKVVGIPMSLSASSLISFAMFGVTVYFTYELARVVWWVLHKVYKILSVVAKPFVWLSGRSKRRKEVILREHVIRHEIERKKGERARAERKLRKKKKKRGRKGESSMEFEAEEPKEEEDEWLEFEEEEEK